MPLVRHPIRVSHETIYRFAYSKDGRAEQFYGHLPEHRKRRRPRGYRGHQRGHIFDAQSLSLNYLLFAKGFLNLISQWFHEKAQNCAFISLQERLKGHSGHKVHIA